MGAPASDPVVLLPGDRDGAGGAAQAGEAAVLGADVAVAAAEDPAVELHGVLAAVGCVEVVGDRVRGAVAGGAHGRDLGDDVGPCLALGDVHATRAAAGGGAGRARAVAGDVLRGACAAPGAAAIADLQE